MRCRIEWHRQINNAQKDQRLDIFSSEIGTFGTFWSCDLWMWCFVVFIQSIPLGAVPKASRWPLDMPRHVRSKNSTAKMFLLLLLLPLNTISLCKSLFHHIKSSFTGIHSLAPVLLHAGNTILTGDPSGLRLHQDHNKLVGAAEKVIHWSELKEALKKISCSALNGLHKVSLCPAVTPPGNQDKEKKKK